MQQKTFINANPATGTKGTRITAGYQNNINSELSNVLIDLGVTPDGSKSNQISQALEANYAKLNSPIFTGAPTCPDVASSGNGQQIVNLESMKAYVTAGQLTFTPVQQGGGSNMGTNHVYLGAASNDASNFVIQADSNASVYLVLGDDDTNTYGIRRFGYDHTDGILHALDGNGGWHDIAERNWVTTKLDGYLPLTGGTISGVLNVDEATGTNNQINYTQSGKDAWSVGNDNNTTTGGNFVISRYDTTGTWIDVPLSIDRASGIVAINKGISVSGAFAVTGTSSLDNGTITTNGSGVMSAKGLILPTGGSSGLTVGTASVYQDSTTTDNLVLQADGKYAVLDSSGNFTTLNGGLVSASNVTAGGSVISNGGNINVNGAAGTFRNLNFQSSGRNRWTINTGNSSETGSDAGSDLTIAANHDDGSYSLTPLLITRSNGQVHINTNLIVPTMDATDNSQNAASTAYVTKATNVIQTNINNEASTRAAAITSLQDSKQDNLGFTPVQQSGGANQLDNKVYLGWDGVGLRCQVDSTDKGNIVFTSDLPLPQGMHVQLFTAAGGYITLPQAYSNFVSIQATLIGNYGGNSGNEANPRITINNNSSFTVYLNDGNYGYYFAAYGYY